MAALAVLLATLGAWSGAVATSAAASPGDVTRVGGEGPAGECRKDPTFPDPNAEAVSGDDGKAPLGAAQFNFNSFGSVRSIAVDASGLNVFVPDRSVVRGVNGAVAGLTRPPSRQGTGTSTTSTTTPVVFVEGADPTAVPVTPLAVAVDARADNLYILEPTDVRRVTLKGQPAITTVSGAGPTISVGTGAVIAADSSGHVFVGDRRQAGTIYRIDTATRTQSVLTTVTGGVSSLAVDAGGTALYAAGVKSGQIERIDPNGDLNSAGTPVAGSASGAGSDRDGIAATSASLSGSLAVAVDPLGGHLYIADNVTHRIRVVDLSTGLINTVVGSGQSGYQDAGRAETFSFDDLVAALAVDLVGDVFVLVPNDCAIFRAEKPVPILQSPDTSTPGTSPLPTTPSGGSTGQESSKGAGGGESVNGSSQVNQTQIVPGGNGQNQTGLQVVDPNGSGNATQILQPAPQVSATPGVDGSAAAPLPTPTPAATPVAAAPAPVPIPAPAPVPVQAPAAAPPPAAPAPGPVAGSAPPPAAPQPVANVGLAGGDAPAARGGARYAMVRAEDDSSAAGFLVAGGALLLAVFICTLFVAPGGSSTPKPRPRGAY